MNEIEILKGAMDAQDERERNAGALCNIPYEEYGCDWPDAAATAINALRSQLKSTRELARRLELQLNRNLQGLRNLMEFRKIAGSDRYGALTREEIEQSIMEIRTALDGGKE